MVDVVVVLEFAYEEDSGRVGLNFFKGWSHIAKSLFHAALAIHSLFYTQAVCNLAEGDVPEERIC